MCGKIKVGRTIIRVPMIFFWCTWILVVLIFSNGMATDADCKVCRLERIHGMKAIDCFKRELKSFPKCAATNAEILELSMNRLRKFSREDLSRYKSLKMLYLSDNLLVKLDDDVFEDMTNLNTLDISMNAIAKLPATILQLPSLKSLYLSQNWNINIVDALEGSKPIGSPLTQVDISFTTDDDYMPEFPNFGPVPYLANLNITGNKYSSVNTKSFFSMCNLQVLSSANLTVEYEEPCDCWIINEWLIERKVAFTKLKCPVPRSYCNDLTYKAEEFAAFEECRQLFADIKRRNKIFKISVGLGSSLVVILSVVLAAVIYRKKRGQRKAREAKNQKDCKPPENLDLLNNRIISEPNEYKL